MPDFQVRALDRQTGQPAVLRFRAETEEEAIRQAGQRGYVVEEINLITTLDYADPRDAARVLPLTSENAHDSEPLFRVVMFHPTFDPEGLHGRDPAEQLEKIINRESDGGWMFYRLETLDIGDSEASQRASKTYLVVFRAQWRFHQ